MDEKNITIASRPLELDELPHTEMLNYGNGFVPFTLSLGLFIGAMVITMVFPGTEPLTKPGGAFSWYGSKFITISTAAVLQAVIASFVLLYGIGITVENTFLFLLFTVIVSLTFVTLLHFLSAVFKDAGRLLMVLLIIFQITGSGGTFPVDMVPSTLQHISGFLPMTYAIAGFRTLVGNDHYTMMWQQVGFLSIFFFTALIGSSIYFMIRYRSKKRSKLETAF